jgi:hypothetical protein
MSEAHIPTSHVPRAGSDSWQLAVSWSTKHQAPGIGYRVFLISGNGNDPLPVLLQLQPLTTRYRAIAFGWWLLMGVLAVG